MSLDKDIQKLQKGDFQYIIKDIRQRFSHVENSWAKRVVVIHSMLDKLFDYHDDGSMTPSEVLKKRSGNCVDKGRLVSNLYLAAGFDVRLLTVANETGEKRHLSVEVNLPVSDIISGNKKLRDTHENLFGDRPGSMKYTKIGSDVFYLADPGWCRYIGDSEALEETYIRDTGSSWEWIDLEEKRTVRCNDFYESEWEIGGCRMVAENDTINWEANLP